MVLSQDLDFVNLGSQYFAKLMPHLDMAIRRIPPAQADNLDHADNKGLCTLTSREQEIMEWVRAGKTNDVIGQILDISHFTVKNHLKRIYVKLGVSNRAHAVSVAEGHVSAVPAAPTKAGETMAA